MDTTKASSILRHEVERMGEALACYEPIAPEYKAYAEAVFYMTQALIACVKHERENDNG